jgi:hypothetical protein
MNDEIKTSIPDFLKCAEAGINFCAFCGRPTDTSFGRHDVFSQPEEGFVVSGDGKIYHTECYVYQVYPKRMRKFQEESRMDAFEEIECIYGQGRLLNKEFIRWVMANLFKRSLTKEDLRAYRIFKTEPRKNQYDIPLELVFELLLFAWKNHYRRGLAMSGYDITVKSARMSRHLYAHF